MKPQGFSHLYKANAILNQNPPIVFNCSYFFDVFIYLKCSGNEQVFLEFDAFLYFNIYHLIIFFQNVF